MSNFIYVFLSCFTLFNASFCMVPSRSQITIPWSKETLSAIEYFNHVNELKDQIEKNQEELNTLAKQKHNTSSARKEGIEARLEYVATIKELSEKYRALIGCNLQDIFLPQRNGTKWNRFELSHK